MVPPSTASPPNPQATQQFLSSVLSQRGPSALPYSEDTKWLIRQHLVSLSAAFPSLEPKTATFTHNDGRSVNLLQADGTVPISFHGVTYNIPVLIWLIDSYPRHPPCVYVNPTRDMIIKRPHPHVNPSGLVSAPYLHSWVYPSSNLADLAKELSLLFARDPPLYSQRRPDPTPAPVPAPSPSFNYPPRRPRPATDDAAEVFRRNAVAKLVDAAHADATGMRKAREAEVEGMFAAQGELRRREEELARGLREMAAEKEALENQLQVVLTNSDVLESWVRENKAMASKTAAADEVEHAFDCLDPLSKQMMECTASDLALEDAIYALDKAVQDGAVPSDQYLRTVRLLSREQFFHRATATKVRAVQMQAQVTNMASRISQFVS